MSDSALGELSTPSGNDGRSLARRATRGAFVTTGGQALRVGLQMLSIVILARLLEPRDYGLMAMVMVVVGLGEIFRDFGLSAATIQAPSLSRGQRDNLFWANTALGVGLFFVVFAGAGLIADVFHEPELVELTRVIAVIFILNGMTAQFRAGLSRSMRFTAITVSELAAQGIGLVIGVSTALAGWGYWSLAAMQIGQAVVTLLLLVGSARWLPGRPRRGVPMAGFWRFGVYLVGSQIVTTIGSNADSAILGYRLGATSLGLYDRAYRSVMAPLVQLRAPITSVAVPTLSRLQRDEPAYNRALLTAQVAIGYTLVPMVAVMVAAHDPIVAVMLGPQWSAAAPILGILAAAALMNLLSYLGYWVYLSRGLTKQIFAYTFISTGVRIACILVGSFWGAIGVAFGVLVASTVLWPISLWWLSRFTVLPIRQLYVGALRVLTVAGAACAAGWLAATWLPLTSSILLIGAATLAVAGAYAACLLIPAVRRDAALVLSLIVQAMPGRKRPDEVDPALEVTPV